MAFCIFCNCINYRFNPPLFETSSFATLFCCLWQRHYSKKHTNIGTGKGGRCITANHLANLLPDTLCWRNTIKLINDLGLFVLYVAMLAENAS